MAASQSSRGTVSFLHTGLFTLIIHFKWWNFHPSLGKQKQSRLHGNMKKFIRRAIKMSRVQFVIKKSHKNKKDHVSMCGCCYGNKIWTDKSSRFGVQRFTVMFLHTYLFLCAFLPSSPDPPSCITSPRPLQRHSVGHLGVGAAGVHIGRPRLLRLQTQDGRLPLPLLQGETHKHAQEFQLQHPTRFIVT